MRASFAFVIGSIICLASSTAAGAQDVTLRFSAWLPPTYFMLDRGLYPYFKDIEEVTEGRVKVEISSAALGPPPRNYQLAMDGVADITWGLHGYTPGTFPLSEMVELPFHSTNAVDNSVAYWRVFEEHLEPAGMHPGVHTLTVHTQPPGSMFNSVRPIEGPDDFAGLKIRSTNSGVAQALELLGATPIGLPVTEMREALSKGIVDGVSLTDEALYNFNIADFVKYEMAVPGGLYNASMFLVVNPATWERISPEDQAAIMEISGEALARRMGKVWQDEQDQAVARAIADGIVINVPEGELLAYIEDKLAVMETEWLERAAASGADAEAALRMYRDLSQGSE